MNITARLKQTLEVCDIHRERLEFATRELGPRFPLTVNTLLTLSGKEIAVLDQMVFRFGKLQDTMGSKLFVQILEFLGEDYQSRPFLDVLTRLEKLELLADTNEWMRFREIRNDLAHEYPSQNEEKAAGLNNVFESTPKLVDVYKKMKEYITQRLDAHAS